MRIAVDQNAIKSAMVSNCENAWPTPDDDGLIQDLEGIAESIRDLESVGAFLLTGQPAHLQDPVVRSLDVSIPFDENTYCIDLAARLEWSYRNETLGTWLHIYGEGNQASLFMSDDANASAIDQWLYLANEVARALNAELYGQQQAWTAALAAPSR